MGQKALAAAITLLLMHIGGHQIDHAANVFEHQRSQDLYLVESSIAMIEDIFKSTGADTGYGDVGALHKLLKFEAEAAYGTPYSTWMDRSSSTDATYRLDDLNLALKIPIPYHGCICISRDTAILSRNNNDTSQG